MYRSFLALKPPICNGRLVMCDASRPKSCVRTFARPEQLCPSQSPASEHHAPLAKPEIFEPDSTKNAQQRAGRTARAARVSAWELIRKAHTANLKFIAARAGNIKLLLKLLLHAAGF
jgi:hypothetical protein